MKRGFMAVKKGTKEKSIVDVMREQVERINKENPIIQSRWYVVEVTPSKRYSYDNGHGGAEYDWTDEKVRRVSPYFECDGQCYEWAEMYDPDEGNTFEIYREDYRRTVTEKWWPANRVAKIAN